MAAFLFLKALFEGLHQFVKAPHGFDFGHFFGAQMLFRHLLKPLLGNVHGLQHIVKADILKPLECGGKGLIKFVDVTLVFDHGNPGEIVKRLNVVGRQTGRHAIQKRQKFAHGYRHFVAAQLVKEGQEHPLCLRRANGQAGPSEPIRST